jgi:hypothetical protein
VLLPHQQARRCPQRELQRHRGGLRRHGGDDESSVVSQINQEVKKRKKSQVFVVIDRRRQRVGFCPSFARRRRSISNFD